MPPTPEAPAATGRGDSQPASEDLQKPSSSSTPQQQQGEDSSISSIPRQRQSILKWNGWGYRDSGFILSSSSSSPCLTFTGARYPLGSLLLPHFTAWVTSRLGGDFSSPTAPIALPPASSFPPPQKSLPPEFLQALSSSSIPTSLCPHDRLFRSHGHTLHDIWALRSGTWGRIPDAVVWPGGHAQVVEVIALATKWNVVLIPFGGGTSVSGALEIPEDEERPVVSLDTSSMAKVLHVDEVNLVMTAEAGITGQDLERFLRTKGYTTGHEPDSYEFSTLGGWVATRASGMKKNTYGNIEDLLVDVRMVSPSGTVEKGAGAGAGKRPVWPRISAGPDPNALVLGSEGSLGVVTEVTLKIRPLPPVRRYGSVVFPDFARGVACLREVARQRAQPSSIRLMDNEQFKFGHSLRPPTSLMGSWGSKAKQIYLTWWKGLDLDRICVATLLFEGTKPDVDAQEAKVYAIAAKFGGMPGGDANGERGYVLTFVIAYIRDIALDYSIVAESFETSVPWSNVFNLCENTKLRVANECRERGIVHHFITCRVTQTYDAGACVYFYFAFNHKGIEDPVKVFEDIEFVAREEILSNGGSISHHHGIGKIRQRWWVGRTLTPSAALPLLHAKKALDPTNVFNNGNVLCSPQLLANNPNQLKAKL